MVNQYIYVDAVGSVICIHAAHSHPFLLSWSSLLLSGAHERNN